MEITAETPLPGTLSARPEVFFACKVCLEHLLWVIRCFLCVLEICYAQKIVNRRILIW